MEKLSSSPAAAASASPALSSSNEHAIVIDNDLDKECSALGGLFQQIVNEMKVGLLFGDDSCVWYSRLDEGDIAVMIMIGHGGLRNGEKEEEEIE